MTADAQQPQREPVNKGELEYGSILPNGDDWRLRKFDAGMGESEYRIFKNETFFAMFDNRKDADMIMGLMTRPQTPAPASEPAPEQCKYPFCERPDVCEKLLKLHDDDKARAATLTAYQKVEQSLDAGDFYTNQRWKYREVLESLRQQAGEQG